MSRNVTLTQFGNSPQFGCIQFSNPLRTKIRTSVAMNPRFAILLLAISLVGFSNCHPLYSAPQDVVGTEAAQATDTTPEATSDGKPHSTASATDDHKVGKADGEFSGGIVGHLITLVMLVLLQAVLGLDNLLYISLESKRAPEDKQKMVRVWGIGLAIALRIILLIVLIKLVDRFQVPWFETPESIHSIVEGHFNLHSIIVLLGGVFILYTAVKEIWHMIRLEEHDHEADAKPKTVGAVIFWIVLMNVVFSFDSILSAMALTKNYWVMTLAIIIGGVLMIVLSDAVANFLKKNRMYEVLGLFILLIVGVMLLSEGGHLAHLKFLGNKVEAMSKATFYFVIGVLVIIEIVQSRYQKKLLASKH